MNYVLSCIILAFASFTGLCQDMLIMGKVTDENGKSVGNVHIVVDGKLGEATSDNSGFYHLELLSTAKPGQGITLRIEDTRFELFTIGIVAGSQIKNILLIRKTKNRVAGKFKDSVTGSSKAGQTITLDNPTFNAPTQIGNYNTQNIINPSVEFIRLSDSLRIAMTASLTALKRKYPNAKSILIKFEKGNARFQVAKSLGELLQSTSLGRYFNDPTSGYDSEHPFDLRCGYEDTAFVKEFLFVISPMLKTKCNFQEFMTGLPVIYIHINGEALFKQDGSYVIE